MPAECWCVHILLLIELQVVHGICMLWDCPKTKPPVVCNYCLVGVRSSQAVKRPKSYIKNIHKVYAAIFIYNLFLINRLQHNLYQIKGSLLDKRNALF